MNPTHWFILIGALLILMTVISTTLKRLPLSAAILYLIAGIVIGPSITRTLPIDPLKEASLFRLASEIVVIVSLFSAGLKLRSPLRSPEWRAPVLLATVSMVVTVTLVAALAVFALDLPWGAAILLGAILAPTDPVLASSVQVTGPEDKDRLRFSLTAEAGLNDGTAFPFVMLGLGLLGLHEIGPWGMKWMLVDVLWASIGGLAVGTLIATAISKLVGNLRRKQQETDSLDDFLALGLIALSYGVAVACHTYGFLAVFASGLAVRRSERDESKTLPPKNSEHLSGHFRTDTVTGHMAEAALIFNEQLGRIGEMVTVLCLGSLLSVGYFSWRYLMFALALFFIIRPVSTLLGVLPRHRSHRLLLSWFGIRGIGSIYYLAFAIEQGVPETLALTLTGITITVVVSSIFIHGITATPLMLRHMTSKQN